MLPLESESDLDNALDESEKRPILLYKHSNACGSSLFSRREIEAVSQDFTGQVYELVVQQARGLSNEISRQFSVRHETPQVIVIRHGKVTLSRSHGSINRDELKRVMSMSVESSD